MTTSLPEELRREIDGEVRFDAGSRALYAVTGSNYRQLPIGVVVPKTIDDVIATVAICRRHGAPVLGRGGATSLAGQCVAGWDSSCLEPGCSSPAFSSRECCGEDLEQWRSGSKRMGLGTPRAVHRLLRILGSPSDA